MYGLENEPEDTDALVDSAIVARTAWGEARGEGSDGMHCVINVIQNRVASGIRWWGHSPRSVCLHPWQFSCWNAGDPNRAKLLSVTETDKQFNEALKLTDRALAGDLSDITHAATSYYDSRMRKPPKWAIGIDPVFIGGHHWFYKI